jgi:hypothetical protein
MGINTRLASSARTAASRSTRVNLTCKNGCLVRVAVVEGASRVAGAGRDASSVGEGSAT